MRIQNSKIAFGVKTQPSHAEAIGKILARKREMSDAFVKSQSPEVPDVVKRFGAAVRKILDRNKG